MLCPSDYSITSRCWTINILFVTAKENEDLAVTKACSIRMPYEIYNVCQKVESFNKTESPDYGMLCPSDYSITG